MCVNSSKSKVLSFNFTRKHGFYPQLNLHDSELEVVENTKLLGVMCSSTGKWNEHIKYIAKKANTRLYFVRRLKKLGASIQTLKETYILFVRPILEMCATVHPFGLEQALYLKSGKSLSESLKRIQRILFANKHFQTRIILAH